MFTKQRVYVVLLIVGIVLSVALGYLIWLHWPVTGSDQLFQFNSMPTIVFKNNDDSLSMKFNPQDPRLRDFIKELGLHKRFGVQTMAHDGRSIYHKNIREIRVLIEPAIQPLVVVKNRERVPILSYNNEVISKTLVVHIWVNKTLIGEDDATVLKNLQYQLQYITLNALSRASVVKQVEWRDVSTDPIGSFINRNYPEVNRQFIHLVEKVNRE